MKSVDLDLIDILEQSEKEDFLLPNFQRSFVWDISKQKRLLASFILQYPIGGILLLKDKKNIYAVRELCKKDHLNIENEDYCTLLLDGQQRISTLKAVFSDMFNQETRDDLDAEVQSVHSKLQKRWFLKIFNVEESDDFFGIRELSFDNHIFDSLEPDELVNHIEIFSFSDKTPQINNVRSPYYRFKSDFKRSILINELAKDYLIPLFDLHLKKGKPHGIHQIVTKAISNNRVEDLKGESSSSDTFRILKPLDLEDKLISEESITAESEYVNKLWQDLGQNWNIKIINFIENLIEHTISSFNIDSKDSNKAFAIFQEINLGGTKLDDFDLISAKVARHYGTSSFSEFIHKIIVPEIHLPPSITCKIVREDCRPESFNLLSMNVVSDQTPIGLFRKTILYMLSILSNVEYGKMFDSEGNELVKVDLIRSKSTLKLDQLEVTNNIEKVITSLQRAFAFLHIRCGVIYSENIPYDLMILPIAYVLYDDDNWENEHVINKIEYWYWGSIFGGKYFANQNSVSINDLRRLHEWILKGDYEDYFSKLRADAFKTADFNDLNTLLMKNGSTVAKSMHTSLLQYTLSNTPKDFYFGKEYYLTAWDVANEKIIVDEENDESFVLKLEDHHIYPIAAATELRKSSKEIRRQKNHILNSPLNRTYISSAANSHLGGQTPERYLRYFTDAIRSSHFISDSEEYKTIVDERREDDDIYDSILKKRFTRIREEIDTELSNLI